MKGVEFREIRKNIGLRQHEIAAVFKVARDTVINWEAKESVPVLASEALLRLAGNQDQIDAIKRLRPKRKGTSRADRVKAMLQKIRDAEEDE